VWKYVFKCMYISRLKAKAPNVVRMLSERCPNSKGKNKGQVRKCSEILVVKFKYWHVNCVIHYKI